MGMDQLYGTGTALDMNRIQAFFDAWYQPECYMTSEDWQYVGLLLLGSLWAFGIGLIVGLIWGWFIV